MGMNITKEKKFQKVNISIDDPLTLLMMNMVASNVQPRELANWHASITQADAADFLAKLHASTQ